MNLRMVVVFVLFCLLAVLVIGFTARLSQPRIDGQRQQRLQQTAAELLETTPTPLDWQPAAQGDAARRYAKIADGWLVQLEGPGYGGTIRLLARYNQQGEFLSMRVYEHRETPGFGTRIARSWYASVFLQAESGKAHLTQLPSELDPEAMDAVIGATVSFRAVARLLQQGASLVTTLTDGGHGEAP